MSEKDSQHNLEIASRALREAGFKVKEGDVFSPRGKVPLGTFRKGCFYPQQSVYSALKSDREGVLDRIVRCLRVINFPVKNNWAE